MEGKMFDGWVPTLLDRLIPRLKGNTVDTLGMSSVVTSKITHTCGNYVNMGSHVLSTRLAETNEKSLLYLQCIYTHTHTRLLTAVGPSFS